MTKTTALRQAVTPYPRHTAQEVAALRPDLAADAAGDAISAVLTADPALTPAEVIEILDRATEDWATETAAEVTP